MIARQLLHTLNLDATQTRWLRCANTLLPTLTSAVTNLRAMASITRLRTTTLTAFSPRSSAQAEQELFEELIVCGPLLAKIFNVGPRSPNEQREVETGVSRVAVLADGNLIIRQAKRS
jgi:hypothetical protein